MTSRLEQRVKEHQQGIHRDAYTFSRRPLELKFYEPFQYVLDAISWEKKIKKWSHKKKQALIDSDWDHLVDLSRSHQKGSRLSP
jgi:putative endonuclease